MINVQHDEELDFPPQPVDAASVRKAFLFTVSTEGSLLHTQTLTVVNIQHTSGKEYVGIILFIKFFFLFQYVAKSTHK